MTDNDRAPRPEDLAGTVPVQQEILTATQLANYFQCKPATVKQWLKHGAFPNAFKIGIQWRIPLEDARAYARALAGQSTPPTDTRSSRYQK